MPGRVTRKLGRRRNSYPWEWALVSLNDRPCADVRHEKEVAKRICRAAAYGVPDGESVLDCGCTAIWVPVCSRCGEVHDV